MCMHHTCVCMIHACVPHVCTIAHVQRSEDISGHQSSSAYQLLFETRSLIGLEYYHLGKASQPATFQGPPTSPISQLLGLHTHTWHLASCVDFGDLNSSSQACELRYFLTCFSPSW